VRSLLALLVLSCLLLGVLGAGLLLARQYRQGHQQLEHNTLQTARALAQAVDKQVFKALAIGQAVAASSALGAGELAAFHH
jgi:CHASE3 domain sensor protein